MPFVYGMSEIARELGVTRKVIGIWRVRGKLPEPTEVLATGPVWKPEDIEWWIAEQKAKRG